MKITKILLGSFLIFSIVSARYKSVKSDDEFYKYTTHFPLCVTQFYTYDKDTLKKEMKILKKQIKKSDNQDTKDIKIEYENLKEEMSRIKSFKNMFKILSHSERYQKANVQFVSINCSGKKTDQICNLYKIKANPTYILFSNEVQTNDGKELPTLAGNVRPDEIQYLQSVIIM